MGLRGGARKEAPGIRQGMRGISAQDLLSLKTQGGGVITEPLMLDGEVLKGFGERKTCMFVCHRNQLCMFHLFFPERRRLFKNIYKYMWGKRVTSQGPQKPAGRELVNASFGIRASLSAPRLDHQTGKLREM